MKGKLNVGDKVAYSAAFVRSCGMDYEMGRMRGTVTAVKNYGDMQVATIDDGTPEPRKVNAANLCRIAEDSKHFTDGTLIDVSL